MRSVDVMLSRPGIYIVEAASHLCFVEVDSSGRAYQLELKSGTYQRDGELRPGGWLLTDIRFFHGPFARSAHTGAV